MEVFLHRALAVLRDCIGGPEPGRPFLIVLLLATLAFVVTLEHVGLVVGMRRFSGLLAWFTGLVSFSVLLAAGTLVQHFFLNRGWSLDHAQIAGVLAAVVAGLVIAVPLLSFVISVSYFGAVCALGLGIVSSLIMGKVATESMRSYHEAEHAREHRLTTQPRGYGGVPQR